jgi:hypothetical protein
MWPHIDSLWEGIGRRIMFEPGLKPTIDMKSPWGQGLLGLFIFHVVHHGGKA